MSDRNPPDFSVDRVIHEQVRLAILTYLASSNLKDIANYCKMHQITYLTTMDFLCKAVEEKMMSVKDCDDFIQKVLKAGSRLPVKSWKDFECRSVDCF